MLATFHQVFTRETSRKTWRRTAMAAFEISSEIDFMTKLLFGAKNNDICIWRNTESQPKNSLKSDIELEKYRIQLGTRYNCHKFLTEVGLDGGLFDTSEAGSFPSFSFIRAFSRSSFRLFLLHISWQSCQ